MKRDSVLKWGSILPVILYSFLLIVLPLVYIFIISFFKSDSYGGMLFEFTLNNYFMLFDAVYIKVFLKSFLIAFIVTFVCILIAYPFSLSLRNKNDKIQKRVL